MTSLLRHQREARSFGIHAHVPRRHVSGLAGGGKGDSPRRAREPGPGGVVRVDHRETGIGEIPDEPGFGREVSLERLVIVEVVAREVGENGGLKHEAIDAALIETVGRHFHRDAGRAAVYHGRERRLEVDGAGRRQIPGLALDRRPRRIERAERPDRPHRPPGADELQPCRRPAIPRFGGKRGGAPSGPALNHDLRNPDRLSRLDHRRRRATRRGVRDKIVTVEHRAAHGAKQHAALEASRIRRQARDRRQRIGRVDQDAGPRQRVHNLFQGSHRFAGGGSANTVIVVPAAACSPCAGQVW